MPHGANAPNPDSHTDSEQDQVALLTLDYLDMLNGSRDVLPVLDGLRTELRQDVLDAWAAIDRLMADEPLPSLSDDPIAIALGVVPTVLLNPTALREVRKARRLPPSSIAGRLQQRGWPTITSDVFQWEQRAEPIAPALLIDLAAALDVPSDALTYSESDPSSTTEAVGLDDSKHAFLQILYSDELNEIVAQWALLQGIGMNAARDDLHHRVAAAAHRGDRTLTNRQWKAVLVVLLANERTRRRRINDPLTGS